MMIQEIPLKKNQIDFLFFAIFSLFAWGIYIFIREQFALSFIASFFSNWFYFQKFNYYVSSCLHIITACRFIFGLNAGSICLSSGAFSIDWCIVLFILYKQSVDMCQDDPKKSNGKVEIEINELLHSTQNYPVSKPSKVRLEPVFLNPESLQIERLHLLGKITTL